MLAPLGLRLAPEKTRVVHIDEGFTFLGFDIRRLRKRGTSKQYVYTTPSRKAIQAIKDKVSAKTYRSTRHQDLDELIRSLNRSLAGWANYFRHGVSKAVFSAVDSHAWLRLMRWIRRKYEGKHRLGMKELRNRFCDKGWRFAWNGVVFTGASSVAVTRYRYRGSTIPTPWTPTPAASPQAAADQRKRHVERPLRGEHARRVRRAGRGKRPGQSRHRALGLPHAGDRRGGWEQPRQSRAGPVLPDGPGAVSETGRYTRGTGYVTPLDSSPALTRWIWAGSRCAPAFHDGRGTPGPVSSAGVWRPW